MSSATQPLKPFLGISSFSQCLSEKSECYTDQTRKIVCKRKAYLLLTKKKVKFRQELEGRYAGNWTEVN